MTDTKALRDKIKRTGFKYTYLAEKLGITIYSLQNKIDNDAEFKVSEIDILSELLGLSLKSKDNIFFCKFSRF